MTPFQRDMIAMLPRLRSLARALTNGPADADDLVQLTLERALKRPDLWSPGTRLDSWMFRILRNTWIDEIRSRRRRHMVLVDTDADHVGDRGAAVVEDRLMMSDIARAMDELPEDQRLAVALVLVDGLSYREAAETLQVPQGTLTSRLARGRAALIQKLDPELLS